MNKGLKDALRDFYKKLGGGVSLSQKGGGRLQINQGGLITSIMSTNS